MALPAAHFHIGICQGDNPPLFQGTSGDDRFLLTSADLKGATFDGGTGIDTLVITDTGDLTFHPGATANSMAMTPSTSRAT